MFLWSEKDNKRKLLNHVMEENKMIWLDFRQLHA
jgi:hypothetical protein